MDAAYDDNKTLQLVLDFGYIPVVPPRSNRLQPWQLDKAMYRFEKLDIVFLGFIHFALIVEALRCLFSVNTP
jgi:hypothetical protein